MALEQPARKKPLCDEARLSVLVRAWQGAPPGLKEEWWALFVNETADWLLAIIRSFRGDLRCLGSHEDIRADLVLHLHNRVLSAYRPGRGKLYSLVTVACQNYIRTLLEKAQRLSQRYILATDYLNHCDTEPEFDSLEFAHEPEVYEINFEIRERLARYTALNGDIEFYLVRNLVVYWYGRGGGRHPPTLEQIAASVAEVCFVPTDRALIQTRAAVNQLQNELAEFRGRPSLYRNLYRNQLANEPQSESLPLESESNCESNCEAFAPLDFSWQ
jgi:hypothetical protein